MDEKEITSFQTLLLTAYEQSIALSNTIYCIQASISKIINDNPEFLKLNATELLNPKQKDNDVEPTEKQPAE